MNFQVKRNCQYREIVITEAGATIETGLLDEKQRRALADDLQEVIDELLLGIENQ